LATSCVVKTPGLAAGKLLIRPGDGCLDARNVMDAAVAAQNFVSTTWAYSTKIIRLLNTGLMKAPGLLSDLYYNHT